MCTSNAKWKLPIYWSESNTVKAKWAKNWQSWAKKLTKQSQIEFLKCQFLCFWPEKCHWRHGIGSNNKPSKRSECTGQIWLREVSVIVHYDYMYDDLAKQEWNTLDKCSDINNSVGIVVIMLLPPATSGHLPLTQYLDYLHYNIYITISTYI